MGVAHVRHVQRTAHAVVLALAPFLVLGAAEIGGDVVPAPSLATELAPLVIIALLAAHIEHGVDRG